MWGGFWARWGKVVDPFLKSVMPRLCPLQKRSRKTPKTLQQESRIPLCCSRLFSGRQDIQASRPLDHSCLTAAPCVSSRSKVNDCHHQSASSPEGVREGKKKKKKVKGRTFPANTIPDQLLCLSAGAQMQVYAERENTCFPAVLTSCSPSTNHRSSGGRGKRLEQQLEWTLPVPVPTGAAFPWAVGPDFIQKHAVESLFFIGCCLRSCFWRPLFLSHERMQRTQSLENISDMPNTERSSENKPLLLAS